MSAADIICRCESIEHSVLLVMRINLFFASSAVMREEPTPKKIIRSASTMASIALSILPASIKLKVSLSAFIFVDNTFEVTSSIVSVMRI
ncbi:hypothetical protein D3C80_1511580 [compost metagenome]